jgi:hypothetical protein
LNGNKENKMTIQNYLMVNESTNVVDNICVWDGDTNTWTPPSNTLMLIQETTPAMVWELSTDKTNYVLVEVLGAGEIGFTWNGTVLTTNQPQPSPISQPSTTGTTTA